jgi:hypothetical protein
MRYTALSPTDTKVWLNNLNKTILLIKKVLSTANLLDVKIKMDALEYHHRSTISTWYANIFYGLYGMDDIVIGPSSGSCYSTGGSFFMDLGFSLTKEDVDFKFFRDELVKSGDTQFCKDLMGAWSIYAARPFDIEESDVINYLRILKIHSQCKSKLQILGVYDEACDVVEDSRSRG